MTTNYRSFFASVMGGVIGALATGLFLMILSSLFTKDAILPLRGFASIVLGQSALISDNNLSYIAGVGVSLLLVSGAISGVIFSLVVGKILTAHSVNIAILFSLTVWIVLELFVFPRYFPFFNLTIPPIIFAFGMVVYGIFLGWIYRLMMPVYIHYHHKAR